MAKPRINVRLEQNDIDELFRRAKAANITVSELVREIITEWLTTIAKNT